MTIELKTAKYKGVEFAFIDADTIGGNRLIRYNFPGSDKQAIERQGKVPRTFNMTAVIPHDDYYQQRDNLLRVLEDGESDVLTHPTFGDVANVINGQYRLTERISELGRAEITIPFEVNDAPGIPQQSGALVSQVQALQKLLIDQLSSDLANGYKCDLNFSGNFSDGIANINNVAAAFAETASYGNAAADKVAAYRSAINNLSGAVGSLIQAPANLAAEISGLFEDLNNLYETPEELAGAFELLYSFGDDDPVVKTNTVGRVQRVNNRNLVRANMKIQAISYAYIAAADTKYTTTDDLELMQDKLEGQYVDIRTNEAISNEALELLDRLRVQAQKTLDVARVNTRSIITIETTLIPLPVLVYSYYGSTELVDIIAELNNVKQHAFVEGELRILTA